MSVIKRIDARQRDPVEISCNVLIEVQEAATGRLLSRQTVHNLVTLAGRNLIRDLLCGDSTSILDYFAVGTDGTAPASGNTALGTEVFRDATTKSVPSAGKLQLQFYLPSTAANGNTLREVGILTASSGGTLFARAVYAAIEKTASIAVTFTWDININAG